MEQISLVQQEQEALLKSYLKRLNDGEALESVRADFVKKFKDVGATEIMQAEQGMIEKGLPVDEVKRLCDVHAALFHGNIRQDREQITRSLVQQTGHPLSTFTKENEALAVLIEKALAAIKTRSVDHELVQKMRQIAIHYAKKGDLLYPHLKVKYGIAGPSEVMWTVDDEIRDEFAALCKVQNFGAEETERFAEAVTRAEEMIYKEAQILFPNCAYNFTTEEWIGIYQDAKDYPVCFDVVPEKWEYAEKKLQETHTKAFDQTMPDARTPRDREIFMAGGHMTVGQLTEVLNTIPMEITFVDDRNINRFFNEGPKDFKRPGMAIDREVFSCHPPKVEQKVRRILEEFRAGTLDQVPVWMEKNGKTMLVTYRAVRDKEGNYLGTLELVQDMDFAKEYFCGR